MRTVVASALAVAFAACSSAQSSPARLSAEWPNATRSYPTVTDEWTRSGRVIQGFDKVLEVSATFLSPEWRAAYVAKRAKVELMGDEAREALAAEQRAASEQYYEVELLVSTYRHEENDLNRGDRSTWRVVLVDDEGNEVAPTEIKRDRRPREVIRAYFPAFELFHTPYIARFPRTVELLGPDARKLSLKIASVRGGLELVWTAR